MTEVLDISVIERDKTILILFICYHLYLKILFDKFVDRTIFRNLTN